MKNLLLLTLIIFGFNSHSQELNIPESLTLSEQKMMLKNVERNGFTVILDGDSKSIRKQFSAYLQETYKWNLKNKSKILIGEDLFNSSFSDKHFTIQAMIEETKEGNELRYFMSFGTDIYVNSTDYPNESEKCLMILKEFSKHYYSKYVNKKIEAKNKEIKSSKKELAGVTKDINSNAKSSSKAAVKIEKLNKKKLKTEEKIRKLEVEIDENETEVANTESERKRLEEESKNLESSKTEIETKISENEALLLELQSILTKINNY